MNEELKTEVFGMAKQYELAVKSRIGLQKLYNQYKFDIESHEKRVQRDVAMAKDALGKPQYPNDTGRNAEIFDRLNKDDQYKRLVDMAESVKDQLVEEDGNIEIARMTMKAYDILTR